MSQSVHEAHESRDAMKTMWLDAEDKAETWKRRYENLASTTQSSFEE